jgi:hypothetical protein
MRRNNSQGIINGYSPGCRQRREWHRRGEFEACGPSQKALRRCESKVHQQVLRYVNRLLNDVYSKEGASGLAAPDFEVELACVGRPCRSRVSRQII